MEGIDASTDQEAEALAEQFFSQPPPVPCEVEHDDWQAEPMSSLERVAMLTTVAPLMAVLAVAVTLLLSEPLSARPDAPRALAAEAQWVSSVAAPPEPAPVIASAPAPAFEPVLAPAPAPSVAIASEPPRVAEAPPPIAQAPRAPSVKLGKPASAPLVRARKALSEGDAFFARELAQQAVQDAPEQAAPYIVLAGAYDKLGDRSQMHATFRACAQRAQDKLAEACKSFAR